MRICLAKKKKQFKNSPLEDTSVNVCSVRFAFPYNSTEVRFDFRILIRKYGLYFRIMVTILRGKYHQHLHTHGRQIRVRTAVYIHRFSLPKKITLCLQYSYKFSSGPDQYFLFYTHYILLKKKNSKSLLNKCSSFTSFSNLKLSFCFYKYT